MTIGELIKQARKDKKVKITDLASQINLTIDELYAIEMGTTTPEPEILKKIMELLDIRLLSEKPRTIKVLPQINIEEKTEKKEEPKLVEDVNNRVERIKERRNDIAQFHTPKYKAGEILYKKEWERKFTPRPRMEILMVSEKIDAKYEKFVYFVKEIGVDIGGDIFTAVTERHLDNHWILDKPL